MYGKSPLTSLLNCVPPFSARLTLHHIISHSFSTNSLALPPPPEFVKLCSQGHIKEAFANFTSFVWADTNLFSHLLKACIEMPSVCLTKQLHSVIVTAGCFKHRFVANHLLNAYSKLGQLDTAVTMFERLPKRNTMSYNILIGGFIQKGDLDAAFKLFDEMAERNLATWNAMIVGLVQYEMNEDGLSLFSQMHELGYSPDVFTLGSVFKGCAGLKDLDKGKQVHGFVVKLGLEGHLIVGNALAHMYMRSGNFREGEKVIRLMPTFSVAACNTLISGMAQNGYSEGAMVYYNIMKKAEFRPDKITFVSVISSCSDLALLAQGQQVHADVVKVGALADVPVVSSLVSMYSKSGCLDDAVKVFRDGRASDVVLWSSMIAAYGFHGRGKEAIELFVEMEKEGLEANEVTFLSLLYACSHCGLKDKGLELFRSMKEEYRLKPGLEHYTCIVDLLARSGRLDEAEGYIRSMPFKPDLVIWNTLMSGCKLHKNSDMAKRIAEEVFKIDPKNPASLVLLANIQASTKSWGDVSEMRKAMRDKNVKKEPGISWLELKNRIHQFVKSDKAHPQSEEIDNYLKELIEEIKLEGYVPDVGSVLHDMSVEEKEYNLVRHSEKIAIAFALMNTPDSYPIRVMKNLRVCNDCHVAIKYISKVRKREIILRDASRFHHFKDGSCSCGDYW